MAVEPINLGPVDWHMVRDEIGNREYRITFKVRVPFDETLDPVTGLVTSRVIHGPGLALDADGLPQVGDTWSYGDDLDGGAWCRLNAEVEPQVTGEPWDTFLVKYLFSSKPLPQCQEGISDDPLLDPIKLETSSARESEEATHDRWGHPLLSSSHEPLRGEAVTFEHAVLAVKVVMNIPVYSQFLADCEDTVNSEPLWGYKARQVKLTRVSQTCQYTGKCVSYVRAGMEFHCKRGRDGIGWDKWALDEGSKALRGDWSYNAQLQKYVYTVQQGADPADPSDFKRFHDYTGNPMRAVLDGQGFPAQVPVWTFSQFIAVSSTEGAKLNDSDSWRVLSGEPAGEDWEAGFGAWKKGQVVQYGGSYFLATRDVPPDDEREPGGAPDAWLSLGEDAPIELGTYTPDTSYGVGSVVNNDFSVRPQGRILVSVLEENDFLLLGIPAALECPG